MILKYEFTCGFPDREKPIVKLAGELEIERRSAGRFEVIERVSSGKLKTTWIGKGSSVKAAVLNLISNQLLNDLEPL